MNAFWKLITEALWQEDLSLGEKAQAEHNRLVVEENKEYAGIVEEVDRVKREDQPETNNQAKIYLDSLTYDLDRIKRNQRRRREALEGHTKTIKMYHEWDKAAAATKTN